MGKESSVVDLIQIARKAIESEFGVTAQNLAEMRELVGEQQMEIPNIADIPTFLPPEEQVRTTVLGQQVIDEMSDTLFTDETENEIESHELELKKQSSLEQDVLDEIK